MIVVFGGETEGRGLNGMVSARRLSVSFCIERGEGHK